MLSDIENNPIKASRFLQRATFGVKKDDLEQLMSQGVLSWFEEQATLKESLHLPLARAYTPNFSEIQRVRLRAKNGAWWNLAFQAKDQVKQRMAFALSQIFVVSFNGIAGKPDRVVYYYDILLKNALGNYRKLMEEVTLTAAMGQFLTMDGSRKADPAKKTFPDENYAREIMQLFTIGLWELNQDGTPKLDANGAKIPAYSQEDVEELARAFTGWFGKRNAFRMTAKRAYHDTQTKHVLGKQIKANLSPRQDIRRAMDILFAHSNTPPFVATLLIKRLVTSNPRPEYVRRVANAFKDNGAGVRGDLKATLLAVLTDSDAINERGLGDTVMDSRSHFGKAKEPIVALTQIGRGLNIDSKHDAWNDYFGTYSILGQAPLEAPSVFNFYTPDFAPQGEIADKELTAPEFKIINAQTLHDTQDLIHRLINGASKEHWIWDKTEFEEAAKHHEDLIGLIEARFFCQSMSNGLKNRLSALLAANDKLKKHKKVRVALYTALTSPEFFTQEALS
ncbi:DUF1800 domain-containing protein [Enterovibrio nigricans]|uniref:DUF1800 domain-containing protein n=1 Tax=Enterovibrio nigricans DSM 22720 TaxID=1121868 RepID=A0A1T4V7P5_9GAMM|nr:DUF1800 family protein [Enterovibrio nigricans]PKF50257.1 DUF1800 domain-containing protein [Enterovibrio nigricans]SKA61008.1 Protein of unknown function [Enterovibrio nigricans DSM 22720]